ncbi:flagellar basal-body rod modification protein FlgD [Novosphingobium sp. PhB57]|uniref:flagellar hook assembly protein FlgD n=1 Tax=Novosphingobium sp. PhB57 TaxID=2485107 RepID=UPI001053070A|nr:flagellar hook capping FlgD N-terminal domain-containing protein [Novosphingobium sp. PhB57]TCU55943.1 flagellar basal-body rod modification protein FlgD [Novosphingobium sp. PhB57]
MTFINTAAATSANKTTGGSGKTSLGELDQGDFLKLMMAQMKQQDPFSPVDQTQMLAQMAQFSSLAGTTEMADTLKTISSKLDTLVSAQTATQEAIAALGTGGTTRTAAAGTTDTETPTGTGQNAA